jgi:hypothetical protein
MDSGYFSKEIAEVIEEIGYQYFVTELQPT